MSKRFESSRAFWSDRRDPDFCIALQVFSLATPSLQIPGITALRDRNSITWRQKRLRCDSRGRLARKRCSQPAPQLPGCAMNVQGFLWSVVEVRTFPVTNSRDKRYE